MWKNQKQTQMSQKAQQRNRGVFCYCRLSRGAEWRCGTGFSGEHPRISQWIIQRCWSTAPLKIKIWAGCCDANLCPQGLEDRSRWTRHQGHPLLHRKWAIWQSVSKYRQNQELSKNWKMNLIYISKLLSNPLLNKMISQMLGWVQRRIKKKRKRKRRRGNPNVIWIKGLWNQFAHCTNLSSTL